MPHSERAQLQLRKFRQALQTLQETAAPSEDRIVRDSLLLRYVYTFEMAWQSLYQILRDRGDEETPRVAYEVLGAAFRSRLIADADLWRRLRESRNAVTHVYDEAKAIALAAIVRLEGIPAFERLLAALEQA